MNDVLSVVMRRSVLPRTGCAALTGRAQLHLKDVSLERVEALLFAGFPRMNDNGHARHLSARDGLPQGRDGVVDVEGHLRMPALRAQRADVSADTVREPRTFVEARTGCGRTRLEDFGAVEAERGEELAGIDSPGL